jgi:alpha-L-fucosidase
VSSGHHSEKQNKESGPQDIRFTAKGDVLYATALGWPEGGFFTVKSLAEGNPYESREISTVDFISGMNDIDWEQTEEELILKVSGEKPCEAAFTFRIQFND